MTGRLAWPRAALSLAAIVFVAWVAGWSHAWRQAPTYGTNPDYDAEERVNWWLLSANCYQKTKVPLVICGEQGRLFPVEDMYNPDDRGHTLLASLACRFQTSLVDRVTLVRINLSINACGILLVAFMLWMAGMQAAALLAVIFGLRYGLPGPIAGHDAPASYFGIYCLAAVPVIWTASFLSRPWPRALAWMGGILSFFSLLWAALLRQPIGVIGMTATFVSALIFAGQKNKTVLQRWAPAAASLAGSWVILNVPRALLWLRGHFYAVSSSGFYHGHGLWHALYVGLGWVPNPWGIVWDDRVGIKAVLARNPRAIYGTYAYFETIKQLYLEILWKHPWQVLGVYWTKFLATVEFPLQYLHLSIFLWFVILTGTALYRYRGAGAERYPLRIVLALSILFALFALQGVLGIPTGNHLYPLKYALLLMLAGFADVWIAGQSEIGCLSLQK